MTVSLKINIIGKLFYFSSAMFDFEMYRFGTYSYLFKLKHKKLPSRICLRKGVLKILNSLENIHGILLKLCNEIKLFQVYGLVCCLVV